MEIRAEKEKRGAKMFKLRSKMFFRSNSKLHLGGARDEKMCESRGGIQWELRPGGMLVQTRDTGETEGEGIIKVRVSTVSQWHDISIQATSTFGELKDILSIVSNLESKEQRLLFKGKEREDNEYLHMVGVRDKDKVLLLEDPATKASKLHHGLAGGRGLGTAYRTISV